MSLTEVVIEGTLKVDGTLELDRKPELPAGRVTVRLQSVLVLPEGDPFFDMLKGIWAAREKAGLKPCTTEEVEEQRRQIRDQMDEEIEEAGRLLDESPRLRQMGIPTGVAEGPAEVLPQPMPEFPVGDPFWDMMQSIWAGQKARGHVPRSVEEVEAEREQTRNEWEERQQEIERLQEESWRLRDQQP